MLVSFREPIGAVTIRKWNHWGGTQTRWFARRGQQPCGRRPLARRDSLIERARSKS